MRYLSGSSTFYLSDKYKYTEVLEQHIL
jgi:hypothetical protein